MPSPQSKSTSVFHALGSYADRIKEKEQQQALAANTANGNQAAALSASSSTSPSPTTTPSTSKAASPRRQAPAAAAPAEPAAAGKDDDGQWETVTVRIARNKGRPEKQEEKRGSNSRNWREREEKPEASSKKEASDDTATPPTEPRRGKKESPTSSAKSQSGSSGRQTSAATATTPKSAWGSSTAQQSTASPNGTEPNGSSSTSTPAKEAVTPVTASENVTAVATTTTETSTKSTPSEPKTGPADTEGSWRARPKAAAAPAAAAEPTKATPATPSAKKAAPPPAVNAWNMRKKNSPPKAAAASTSAAETAEAAPEVKATTGKKKKKHGGDHHHHHHNHHHHHHAADTTLWPDVSQAAEVGKSTDDKRSKHEKKGSEASVVEETLAQGAKKQKWMPIPAAELQEAADKVAETTRRQGGGKSKSRGGKEFEGGEGKRGKKGGNDSKKVAPRLQRSGSQGSLPPFPDAQRNANGFRFSATDKAEIVNGDGFGGFVNGTLSAPSLSRQGSEQGKRASPSNSTVPLTPEIATRDLEGARGQANGANPPRRGREREGRGGYSGGRGGRGGYRSASHASARGAAFSGELSPLAGSTELANLYSRGYGVGYNYYPVASGGFVVAPQGFDAAQYAASMVYPRSMPPPPLPVTQVANIDALRYYVLGQVEYYFSMQNLAMDFFLRQQMDSEGWIEVSMIASFNRIKSLTPDVAIVREVMEMSILLEVKEDMVRLAGDEGMRWVLPDAPPCKFSGGSPGRNLSPRKLAGEGAELSHGVPDTATASALGIEDLLHAVPMPKFDVENALMRNTRDGSANMSTSSTASVLASDEGKTMTPETSIAGDSKSDFDVDEDIKIEQH